MAKVITYSRQFPAYHPKAGEPTFFVEKILASLMSGMDWLQKEECVYQLNKSMETYADFMKFRDEHILTVKDMDFTPKIHTIRAGKRWKAGDTFSPRVWSGKPYNSKQIILADDIVIPRVADIEINSNANMWIDGKPSDDIELINTLAKNDGLTTEDLRDWFKVQTFSGQIIFHVDVKTPY